nr:group II intron maturase-specific domain-containing protein [uncultured Cedecea sp.]
MLVNRRLGDDTRKGEVLAERQGESPREAKSKEKIRSLTTGYSSASAKVFINKLKPILRSWINRKLRHCFGAIEAYPDTSEE